MNELDLTPFEEEVRAAINRACAENESNTPDWVLARYLNSCLDTFNVATRLRESWYGCYHAPGGYKP